MARRSGRDYPGAIWPGIEVEPTEASKAFWARFQSQPTPDEDRITLGVPLQFTAQAPRTD